jgi:hypothetical protein
MKQGRRDDNDEAQEEGGEDEGRRWKGQKEQGNNNGTDKDEDDQREARCPGRPEHLTPLLLAAASNCSQGGKRRQMAE